MNLNVKKLILALNDDKIKDLRNVAQLQDIQLLIVKKYVIYISRRRITQLNKNVIKLLQLLL
jgi:hypothetical protein